MVCVMDIPEGFSFRIKQDDMIVASTSGTKALAEIMRYAHQYVEDGPIEIQCKQYKGRWKSYMHMSRPIADLPTDQT